MIAFITNNSKKVFLVLIVIVLYADIVYSGRDNPHKSLEDPNQCTECHVEKPKKLPGKISSLEKALLKDNVTRICTTCHEYGERSHPTDKVVDFAVPVDLPLKNNMLTCATCHYPHGRWNSDKRYISSSFLASLFSGRKNFKTYFLRRANVNGELCLVCHK